MLKGQEHLLGVQGYTDSFGALLHYNLTQKQVALVWCPSRHRELHRTDQADHQGNFIPSHCRSWAAWDAQGTITRWALLPQNCCVLHRPADIKEESPSFLAAKGGFDQIQICSAHQRIARMGCSWSQT